jgi:Fe-S cluster biogenesis protein NfuA
MSTEERIEEVLESLRPAIQADGGDVELVRYREDVGIVEVRLMGACESCPISMMTLKEGIERRVREVVPGVTEVAAV